MKKRLLSLSLAICLMLTMLPITATAATNQSEIVKNAITNYISLYNSSFRSSYNGKAWGCCAFCNYVWKGVFGKDIYAGKHTTVDSSSATSDIYGFLSNNHAKTGDILWCHNNSTTHYMIVLAYDSEGVWLSDGKSTGVLWHNNEKISYDNTYYKQHYFGGNCKLRLYKIDDGLWNAVNGNYENLSAPTFPNNIGESSQNTVTLMVSSRISGKWTVTIPANYKLVCYDSADATKSSIYYISAKSAPYTLTCTQRATLSDGRVRYFFVSGDSKNLWFDYTSSMYVPDSNVSYTVTFDPMGGSISLPSKVVTSGQRYGVLPMPSRNGYTFDGWYTSASGGTQVTEATTVSLTSDRTLYAHWNLNCANHTYDAEVCANCGAALPFDNEFDASAAGTYQVSEKTAYIRTGPYQAKDLVRTMSRGETLQVVGSVTNSYNNTWLKTADGYYVHADKLTWCRGPDPQSYYVILDDGSVCNRITVTNGGTYGNLPTPTRDGYTFDGWYTSSSGGTRVVSTTTVNLTGNQTLYAHWLENPQTYILHFDPDGGSVDINSKEVTYGEYYGDLPTPYREGYKFEGWRTGRNGTGSLRWSGKYVTTKSDETVYAHWSPIDTRIRVHFDTNGGPDHGYLYYYEPNDTYGNLPSAEWGGNLPSTEWAGYIFEGWYTKPTGGTKIYSTTKLIQDSEHTLYAHWTKEETPPEPSSLTISGLRVTVSDGKIRASATVTSNYDLMDFAYSNGAAGGGLGSVGKNRKTFEFTDEVDYRNLAYGGAGTYTFWLTCTDMSGNSVTATYDYYLPDPNAPQYFSCNVGIFCVNGKTVNLYNNPGDSSRVDYFSLGQSVGSAYGVYMPDGSTWYRVSVTSKGNVITVWLKYESDKMTIKNFD